MEYVDTRCADHWIQGFVGLQDSENIKWRPFVGHDNTAKLTGLEFWATYVFKVILWCGTRYEGYLRRNLFTRGSGEWAQCSHPNQSTITWNVHFTTKHVSYVFHDIIIHIYTVRLSVLYLWIWHLPKNNQCGIPLFLLIGRRFVIRVASAFVANPRITLNFIPEQRMNAIELLMTSTHVNPNLRAVYDMSLCLEKPRECVNYTSRRWGIVTVWIWHYMSSVADFIWL